MELVNLDLYTLSLRISRPGICILYSKFGYQIFLLFAFRHRNHRHHQHRRHLINVYLQCLVRPFFINHKCQYIFAK